MSQLVLPMTDPDRYFVASARVRAACKTVALGLGYKEVASLWGCHESQVGLKIEEKHRNSIHPGEMLALKAADKHGLIQAAEDDALSPPASAEDRLRRLPGVLRRYFAEELCQLVERELDKP